MKISLVSSFMVQGDGKRIGSSVRNKDYVYMYLRSWFMTEQFYPAHLVIKIDGERTCILSMIQNVGDLTCITISDTECRRTYLYHIKWYRMLEDLFFSHLVIQNDGGLTCITVRSRPSWGTLTSIRTRRIKTSAIYARVVVALVNIYNERNSVYFSCA